MKGAVGDMEQPVRLPTRTKLVLDHLPGSGRRLVVSCAGVGNRRYGVPPHELVGTASAFGTNHVLLVADPKRCWLNAPGYCDELPATIEHLVQKHDIDSVVTMGNSMGAVMAILLAELTHVDVVVALSPQFSVHPDLVPEEWRWKYHRDRIHNWIYPDVGKMDAPHTKFFIFHGDSSDEQWHWKRFPSRGAFNHLIFRRTDHNLARIMQKRYLLGSVARAAFENRPKVLRKRVERELFNSKLTPHRRERYQLNFPTIDLDPKGAPVVVPDPMDPIVQQPAKLVVSKMEDRV